LPLRMAIQQIRAKMSVSGNVGDTHFVPAMNRRNFLSASFCALATTSLAACGLNAPPPDPVDRSRLARTLKALFWSEHVSNAVTRKFESDYSLSVLIDTTNNDEHIRNAIQNNATHGYDVVVASDFMVATLIAQNSLERLDRANIPNLRHIAPRHRQLYYDPENAYSMPYFWGTTGVLFNPEQLDTPITTWQQLLAPTPKLVGRIGMLDDARETVAVALRALKLRGSATQPEQLAEARQVLLQQRASVANYDAPQINSQRVAAGELSVAMTRTYNAMAAIRERPGLIYALPDPVTTVWQQNFAVPAGAVNRYTAEVFINFMLRPDIAGENARAVGAATPNDSAIRSGVIDAAVLNNPVIYPNMVDEGAKFEWLTSIDLQSNARYEALLAELKRG
jgi:spermidine/putrescine transport system substrate-binding protein